MGQVAIDPHLFDWPSEAPRLIGGRHRETGEIVFPAPDDPETWERIPLGTQGTLWTYTVQRFAPKAPPYHTEETPESFRPYAVGYIELPGEVRVEARLTDVDIENIRIGAPYELVFQPLYVNEAGDEVIAWFFRPAAQAQAA